MCRCREVAVVRMWLSVEVRLYYYFFLQTGIAPLPIMEFAYMPFPALINRPQHRILFLSLCIKSIWRYSRWQKLVEEHWLRCLWRCEGLLYVSISKTGQCDPSVAGLGKENVWSSSSLLSLPETLETWNCKRSLPSRSGMSAFPLICEYYELMPAF